MSQSRSNALAVTGRGDPVLHHIAPLGLAAAAGTAVIVDLDPEAATYPGPTLADLMIEGPRSVHLRPARRGVAVFGNGGIGADEVSELVAALCAGWPAVVLRAPQELTGFPTVPVYPLLSGPLAPVSTPRPSVYQQVVPPRPAPGPGIVVPPLSRGKVNAMLRGQVDPRWRWVRAWARVWEVPWR